MSLQSQRRCLRRTLSGGPQQISRAAAACRALAAGRPSGVEAIFPAPGDSAYGHTFTQVHPPAWLADGATAGGKFLGEGGLSMPMLNPEHALLLKVTTA